MQAQVFTALVKSEVLFDNEGGVILKKLCPGLSRVILYSIQEVIVCVLVKTGAKSILREDR
jgi:hypothetical protein